MCLILLDPRPLKRIPKSPNTDRCYNYIYIKGSSKGRDLAINCVLKQPDSIKASALFDCAMRFCFCPFASFSNSFCSLLAFSSGVSSGVVLLLDIVLLSFVFFCFLFLLFLSFLLELPFLVAFSDFFAFLDCCFFFFLA